MNEQELELQEALYESKHKKEQKFSASVKVPSMMKGWNFEAQQKDTSKHWNLAQKRGSIKAYAGTQLEAKRGCKAKTNKKGE